MASRSCSRSSLHSDRASPTPSHASAGSATSSTYEPPKKKPYGKYQLDMTNVPNTMKWRDVFIYIKKKTNIEDKAIAEDITYITLKNAPGHVQTCSVAFQTERMRDRAFELLNKTKEIVQGKHILVKKWFRGLRSCDRASPTPSHASAVSTTSKTSKNKPYGKYLIKIANAPQTMVWQDVLSYVKRHTDPVDKAIAEDITFIPFKKGTGLFPECGVAFKTEQIRDQAFELLKKSKEKVEGIKIFVIKAYTESPNCKTTLHSESNTHSDRASPTPSQASAVSATYNTKVPAKYNPYGKYLIKLINAPHTMTWQDVLSYVKRYTDPMDKAIAEDITFFPCKRGPGIVPERSVAFQTEQIRDQAFKLLVKSRLKIDGKKIFFIKALREPKTCIQSTLHSSHSESNTHSDRASPTPSHASASTTSSTYQTPNNTPYGKYHIKISNVPVTMKRQDVLSYVKRHTDKVDRAIARDITFIPLKKGPGFFLECSLEFRTEQMRDQAFELLKQSTEKIQGKKMYVQKAMGGFIRDRNLNAPRPPLETIKSSILIENNKETYGLSFDYLNDLGITPPLLREIFVQFLPIDYDELKVQRLFSMAGNVVTVNLVKKNEYADAIVEYEHPVEAVQAISMFNNQEIFGTKLKCTLFNDNYTDRTFVPGPGLGPNGAPLKGIRLTIELKKLKAQVLAEYKEMQDSIEELNSQVSLVQTHNTHQTKANTGLGQPISGMEMGNQNTSPHRNMRSGSNIQHRPPFGPNQQINTRFGFQLNKSRVRSRGVVVFYNLPLRVTQKVLLSKVREVGEVKFVRMSRPGKALVCFFTDSDVNKCITLFNQCKVDGQIIRVNKIII